MVQTSAYPSVILSALLFYGSPGLCAQAEPSEQTEAAPETSCDQARLKALIGASLRSSSPRADIPPVYPWMLRENLEIADWLGIPHDGLTLYEPINIIICDSAASSSEEAQLRLLDACKKAGYMDRYGHTSDYLAFLDGKLLRTFPARKRHSFADRPFEQANNHGRIFGPVHYKGKYCFAAAFSRERVQLAPVRHDYVSFNQARDSFAWALDANGYYKIRDFTPLGNAVVGSTRAGTGDHDGVAIVLEAGKR